MQTATTTKIKLNTKQLTISALFAALICVTTAYIFHIPFGVNGGYIHIGDALIYLAAAILPTPYAMAAAAIGGMFADLLTAPAWAIFTFIIKALIAGTFTSKQSNIVNKRNIIALFGAAVISIAGYYIAEVILYGNAAAAVLSVVSSTIQAFGSSVLFIAFGLALDKMKFKSRF